MTFVLGRTGDDGPVARLGNYRARDGSRGAPLALDVDGPHAVAVVGKRGYGKSYTLGVLAEELAGTDGVAPVVLDPMGVFPATARGTSGEPGSGRPATGRPETVVDAKTTDVPDDRDQTVDGFRVTVVDEPTVDPGALDPRSWCSLVGLAPGSAAGSLVWQAAGAAETIDGMCDHVASTDAPAADVRAATNHLRAADRWGVFGANGVGAADLATGGLTVLDLSGLAAGPANAVARVVADALYRARVEERVARLPWLLVDEAHAFFDGVAADGLRTLLTRGRAPGVSLAVATQRPSALPAFCLSQSDVLVAHRLTSERDISALEAARPTYVDESFERRMPTGTGEVLVVDDATETVHAAAIRDRTTPHGGDSPRASEVDASDGRAANGVTGDEEAADTDASTQASPSSGL